MQTTTPENVGLSSERLALIDDTMRRFVKDDQLPGIITLVQRHGEIAHFGMYGHMNIEEQRLMEEDAIFRIYSMTKPIVSIGLMMLLEEGKVGLEEPVGQYIPAFRKTKVYAGTTPFSIQTVDPKSPMTIHHLLTHTSGLSYGWFLDNPAEEAYRKLNEAHNFRSREITLADYVDMLAKLPLLFHPGERWNYSVSTTVVGRLIEVISGQALGEFLAERIFKPLGMDDTGFDVPSEKVNRLAQIYGSQYLYNPFPIPPDEIMGIGDITKPTVMPIGGGGLASTLADYLRFANCLLNGGTLDGVRIIGKRTLQWMTSNHLRPEHLPMRIGTSIISGRFGLGFRVVENIGEGQVLTTKGEFGWAGAAQTYFSVSPSADMIVMFMSQLLPVAPYPVRNRYVNLVHQAMLD